MFQTHVKRYDVLPSFGNNNKASEVSDFSGNEIVIGMDIKTKSELADNINKGGYKEESTYEFEEY